MPIVSSTLAEEAKKAASQRLMVPYDVMFPAMAAARMNKNPAQRARSVQTAGAKAVANHQVADEEWLEGIKRWLELQARGK